VEEEEGEVALKVDFRKVKFVTALVLHDTETLDRVIAPPSTRA
jgi:hypothetical protein